jgi:hypothetical protein
MTTLVQCRDDLVTLIHTNLTGVPVFWENTTSVDLDKAGDRFVRVEIDFDGAKMLTVDPSPVHLTEGSIYFSIFTREGLGTRGTLALMDTISTLVKFRFTTRVRTFTPTPTRVQSKDGWHMQELRVPFEMDSLG